LFSTNNYLVESKDERFFIFFLFIVSFENVSTNHNGYIDGRIKYIDAIRLVCHLLKRQLSLIAIGETFQ